MFKVNNKNIILGSSILESAGSWKKKKKSMKELPEFGIHYKKSELTKSMLSAPKTLNSEAAIRRCS